MADEITTLIVDDHEVVREGLRLSLSRAPHIRVVGEAADGASAVELAERRRPDVVIMDVRMPGSDGLSATARISREHPSARVLVLTTFDLDDYLFGALQAGAAGFLLKNAAPEDLIAAVRRLAAGDAVLDPAVTARVMARFAITSGDGLGVIGADGLAVTSADHVRTGARPDPARAAGVASLTSRERDVLALLARGMSNAEIAASLAVGDATAKKHVSRLLTKLGVRDRLQAVILAYEYGLVPPAAEGWPAREPGRRSRDG
jgi:DNA-binding NarL/FixJ family response regulator